MSENWKECPFHAACELQMLWIDDRSLPPYCVEADCGARGPHADTKAEAIAAWNRRAKDEC